MEENNKKKFNMYRMAGKAGKFIRKHKMLILIVISTPITIIAKKQKSTNSST